MRTYIRKTNRPPRDYDAVLQACKAILIDKKSKKSTARNFNIPKTSMRDIVEHLTKAIPDITSVSDEELLACLKSRCQGSNSIFTKDDEENLIKYIEKSSEKNCHLGSMEVRALAYKYAVKNRIHFPDSWGIHQMAGREWFYGFMKRNRKLSLCTPDEIEDKRTADANPTIDLDDVLSHDIQEENAVEKDPIENAVDCSESVNDIFFNDDGVAGTSTAFQQEVNEDDDDEADDLLLRPMKIQKRTKMTNVNKRKASNRKGSSSAKKSR